MFIFEDIDAVEEWLDPLSYSDFWEALEPYRIFPDGDRDHCDKLRHAGRVDPETMLICLKAWARASLTKKFGLEFRIYEPSAAKYLEAVH